MNKNIFCGIAWSEFSDYPLLRKLIKEELSRDFKKIQIAVPSSPSSFSNKTEKDAKEFLDWLKDEFKEYKNIYIDSFTYENIPSITKYSGNKNDNSISFPYLYPIEYCFNKCDQDYFVRIETDWVVTDWNKIKNFIDETDFDLITTGCLEACPLDVSFWCVKIKAFEEYVTDKTWLNGKFSPYINLLRLPESISRGFGPMEYENCVAYNVNRNTDLNIQDTCQNSYDHFQWMMFQIINKSDKTYVLNPKVIDERHYIGMNQSCNHFLRTGEFCYSDPDKYYKYIKTCMARGCYENYNIYKPFKDLMDKYYQTYELTDKYQKYLEHYNQYKY